VNHPLDAEVIGALLRTRWLGRAWRHLARCRSTNDEAAAWARAGAPAGAVVVADVQEAGRGRLGRAWHAAPGESLCLSVVLRPPLAPSQLPPLTLVAGVALAEAVAALGVVPALKWPNDLFVGGKKAAGILAESACQGQRVEHVVVGIGVNVNVSTFPVELEPIATSLARARGAPLAPAEVAAALCERLEAWHDRFLAEGPAPVLEAWKRFARPGEPIGEMV
jgi:BirA family biotin operon repressor/biotin-[acetyl-CoA-carboxylase] ligase